MAIQSLSTNWGATPAECAMSFPCDRYLPDADGIYFRAVSVNAPASQLFRWLCQLRVAPYSYDWLDNLGKKSPRYLIPGMDKLEIGQRLIIFQLVDFEQDRHLTMRISSPRAKSLYGDIALSYCILPQTDQSCRLIAKLRVVYPKNALSRLWRMFLPWGDLIMMRKQLLTWKQLAEATQVPQVV